MQGWKRPACRWYAALRRSGRAGCARVRAHRFTPSPSSPQVPGNAFGAPDHIRIGFALSVERIGEAMNRLEAFVKGLKAP